MRITPRTPTGGGRRAEVVYLLVQAFLAVVWWAALLAVPAVRERFELGAGHRSGLDAFLVADLVVFIGGSIVSAGMIWRRSRWATFVTSFTAGGIAYATLYLLGWVVLEGSAAAGLMPMVVALAATTVIAVGTRRGELDHG